MTLARYAKARERALTGEAFENAIIRDSLIGFLVATIGALLTVIL